MMMKPVIALIVLCILAAACNMPSNGGMATQEAPDAIFTQAAQTVAAELTRVAKLASPTPNVPTLTAIPSLTFTPTPTNTPVFTATNTPVPCNLATWNPATIDVTIPDNEKMAPNQVFSKTWRIRNIGACSWNSNYRLIFDHGDRMGMAAGYTQQLTPGIVEPGKEVDLIVDNLKAPATPGTYTGYWRLRDPGGVVFGITPSGGPFAVKIVVVAMTSVTLLPVYGESGTVRSDGSVSTTELSVGDSSLDKGIEMFLSYNISGIPSNATVTEVKLDMRNSTAAGNPFGLGVLNLFLHDFGMLDGTDYVSSFPGGGNLADWGSFVALNSVEASLELKKALQLKLGVPRLQLRFQYQEQKINNGMDERLFYGSVPLTEPINNPAIIITYTTP